MDSNTTASIAHTSIEAKIARARRRELIARVVLILAVLGTISYAAQGNPSGPMTPAIIALLVLVWRRMKASLNNIRTDARDDSEWDEQGAPVVYLRPFSQDREVIFPLPMLYSPRAFKFMALLLLHPIRGFGTFYGFRFTFELLLRHASRKVGPLRAIGAPHAKAVSSAVVTQFAGPGDDWRDVVRDHVDRAKLVVLRAGTSEGLLWELETVVDRLDPTKLLIYIGDRQRNLHPMIRLTGWYTARRHRAEFYTEFRERSSQLFPQPLPDTLGSRRFIRFEPDWTPVVVSWRTRSTERTDAERVASYMNSVMP